MTELWIPKTLDILPPLIVIPNGATCRCREIDAYQWQEKPRASIVAYYRLATKAERAELLPEVA